MKTKQLFSAFVLIALLFSTAGFAMEKKKHALDLGSMEYFSLHSNDAAEASSFLQPPSRRYGATDQDSLQCLRDLSLYTEFWNNRNFSLAYDYWREVFNNCPCAQQNTFIRGVQLVKMKYNEETDPLLRERWVDTLMLVYDTRIQCWGHTQASREGLVLGRKAADLYSLRPNNIMEIYEITKRSIELEQKASQADVLIIHMQSLIRLVEAGLRNVEDILLTYDLIMDIIDWNIENNQQDGERFFVPAKPQIDMMFEPYATCDNIIALFKPRFDANPENIELLERITSMLNKSGCTAEKLFFDATKNLHRLRPTAQSAFLMGRLENQSQNFREAVRYFEQAVSLYERDSDKITALMLLADITFRQLRQFPQARTYALEASRIDPSNGRPYILIGEMYAASSSMCGDNDLTRSAVYWAAVDKFVQARNVDSDPVVQERANQLINTFSQHYPSRETTFFHGLNDGDTFRVECWINETTRVRSR